MTFSPTDSILYGVQFADPAVAAIFSDEQFTQSMIVVERALARAQAAVGVIPTAAAQEIDLQLRKTTPDLVAMRIFGEKSGIPVPALLKQLRAELTADTQPYLHYGATTQDIMDSAHILQFRSALEILETHLRALCHSLTALTETHRHTMMVGRTHSQQALPLTFGFKTAGWLAPLVRHLNRLNELRIRLLVLQFGGAVGTLASLQTRGTAVQKALAAELDLALTPIPWHTQRDNIAECASWLSLVSGSLAKMGQDMILMAQTEIGELLETDDPDRGGSSTMPQKRNR